MSYVTVGTQNGAAIEIYYEDHGSAQPVVLGGFSMGTGEVTRYLGRYGSGRVAKAAMFGVIPPFLLRTPDNPRA